MGTRTFLPLHRFLPGEIVDINARILSFAVVDELSSPSLERVQALYFLAVHDFENGQVFRSKVRFLLSTTLSSECY
jgi:hypothetical protein